MNCSASLTSSQARVTAEGISFATSMAKVGPDSTAWGAAGRVSATTSVISLQLPFSIPLAQISTGALNRPAAAMAAVTGRRNCAGATRIAASAPWRAAAMSDVASIAGSSVTPGRYGFSWSALILAAISGSWACRITDRPARRATMASAVPQAPAPMTAKRSMATLL